MCHLTLQFLTSKCHEVIAESMRHHTFSCCISLFSFIGFVHGDVDLRKMLTQAAQKVAEEAGTSLDPFALAGGLCFSAAEIGSGEIRCQDQQVGEQLGLAILLVRLVGLPAAWTQDQPDLAVITTTLQKESKNGVTLLESVQTLTI